MQDVISASILAEAVCRVDGARQQGLPAPDQNPAFLAE